jgi:homoserine O-acetyltransferase/O-succinyltransferase
MSFVCGAAPATCYLRPLHHERSDLVGPGNLGGSPKVPLTAKVGMWSGSPGNERFPFAMHVEIPVLTRSKEASKMSGPNVPRLAPATGAWMPGDPVGHRQFFSMPMDRPFAVDGGGTLTGLTLAYETWGTLSPTADNAVLVCHAWTGDSHAAGPITAGHQSAGWWNGVVGAGEYVDTNRWYIVCVNVLGGCQGSTGPASPHPVDGRPYGSRFPVITIRDMVRAQARLADHLGVRRWHSVVGGSMGGMQVLEWAVTYPQRVGSIVPIATCAHSSAQQIAWGAIGRRSIRLDPKWRGGDYYDAAEGDGPHEGLTIARMVAQVTFRSDNVFTSRFGRNMADGGWGNELEMWQRFEVERYLDHHGDKLVRRFDANSYLVITKAMDLHDVGRGRNGLVNAMARIRVPCLSIGINSDVLYPSYQQREIRDILDAQGTPCEYVEVDSPHGHDAFLINLDQVGEPLAKFLDRVSNHD